VVAHCFFDSKGHSYFLKFTPLLNSKLPDNGEELTSFAIYTPQTIKLFISKIRQSFMKKTKIILNMNKKRKNSDFKILLFILILVVALILIDAYAIISYKNIELNLNPFKEKNTIFQVATFSAIAEGVYDGSVSFSQLKKHGNFGIGTFNALDGEMLMLDGKVYQIKSDGKVYSVSNNMKTPFASVTFFENDKEIKINSQMSLSEVKSYIEEALPTKNIPYAIKIVGNFSYIKTRSVPNQTKPYPLLVEVVKNQPEFEFNETDGTIVGFYLPVYTEKINVAGYHLHFMNAEKTAGGHLLEMNINEGTVEISYIQNIRIFLPEESDFFNTDLTKTSSEDVKLIEG